jgi:anti-anti-sigma factor
MGIDEAAALMNRSVAAVDGLRLLISGREIEEPRLIELSESFAVLGRSDRAAVTLASSKVSYRHAYLQVIDGHVFCVDLASKTGLFWGDVRRSCGWLTPAQSVRIGPYRIQLAGDAPSAASSAAHDAVANPLEKGLGDAVLFPQYTLELFDDSVPDMVRSIDRRITLIGRHPNCSMRLTDESVSRFHCALVLTRKGLWLVDLLGKGGTRLDENAVRCGFVEIGSVLSVGVNSMSAWRREPIAFAPATDVVDPPESEPEEPAAKTLDWLGTLFAIECQGETLIVVPTIRRGILRIAQLQIETNALRRKLLDEAVRRLVIDLHALDYLGAEAIRAVVELARQMEAAGGQAALCCTAPALTEALTNKGLHRIWPLHATREAALAAVSGSA